MKLVFCGDFIQLPPVPDKQGRLDNSQHAHACVAAARRQDAPERQGVPGGATGTEAKRRAGLKDPAVDDGFWLDHKRNTPFGLKEVTGKYAFQSIAWRKARFQVHHLKVVHRTREPVLLDGLTDLRAGVRTPRIQALVDATRRPLGQRDGVVPTVLYPMKKSSSRRTSGS